ncbi:MAG: type III secretion system chaperone [Desulfovibrionaceae bacterium]|nr:type III secretion system chaperone [Desulfovibrionaceae bacterium]
MDASEIIKAFGAKLGIGLEFDADNVCSFEADGLSVTIHNLREIDTIAITGDLGDPPPWSLEDLYRTMLEANYLFRDTSGASLSFNPESGRFALCRAMPCKALDGESFFSEAERFVSTLEMWARIVRDYRAASPKGEDKNNTIPNAEGFLRV